MYRTNFTFFLQGDLLIFNIMCKYNSKSYEECIERCPDEDYFLCPEKILLRDNKCNKYALITFSAYILILALIITLIIIL